MAQIPEQFLAVGLAQVEWLQFRCAAGGADAVEAAAGFVPVIDGAHVAEAGVVPIGHVEAAIGTDA